MRLGIAPLTALLAMTSGLACGEDDESSYTRVPES